MSQPTTVDVYAAPAFLPYTVPAGVAFTTVYTRPCLLGGWVVTNASASTAEQANLYNGDSNAVQRVGQARVLANDTVPFTAPGSGIYCDGGVGVDMTGADLTAVVYIADLP